MDALLHRLLALYSAPELIDALLMPLLETLEQRWKSQLGSCIEQVFVTTWLQQKLNSRIQQQNPYSTTAPALLINLSSQAMTPRLWLHA